LKNREYCKQIIRYIVYYINPQCWEHNKTLLSHYTFLMHLTAVYHYEKNNAKKENMFMTVAHAKPTHDINAEPINTHSFQF